MPKLNYVHRKRSFDQKDHPQLPFEDELPKSKKEISETHKVNFVLSKKQHPQIVGLFMRDQRDPGEDNSNHTKEVQNKPTHSIKVQRTDTTNRNL